MTEPTLECYECDWEGTEDQLVTSTGLVDDTEYDRCPSCWSDQVWEKEE